MVRAFLERRSCNPRCDTWRLRVDRGRVLRNRWSGVLAHGMAYYMRAAVWDRSAVQNRVHGPGRGTIICLVGRNRVVLVPGLGHRVTDLGPGSIF